MLLRELRRAGFDFQSKRVETEPDFVAALHPGLDVILSDFALPTFSAPAALEALQKSGLDIPVIIVSGTIGEDAAVAALKQGAIDYLLKDRLGRLGGAVSHAIEKAKLLRERRQSDEALRASERSLQFFRNLVDQSSDTFEVIDPDTGRFLDVNANGPAELGMTRGEYLSLCVCDIDTTVDPAGWRVVAERIRAGGGSPVSGEGFHRRKDGSTFPIEYIGKLVRLDREYIVTTVRDITARKQSEARLREQAEMLDRAHDAIIVRDIRTRRILSWNQGAERLYGWTAAEALDRDVAELIFVDPSVPDAITRELLATGEWRGEYRQRTKAGGELIVSGHVTLMRDPQGAPKSALTINIDLTEQKNLEAQFLRAQRMEGIGTLAAGVAHDLNNILCPIMLSVPMLRSDLSATLRDEILTAIEINAQRGADIVRQVLTFARGIEGKRLIVQPTHLVKEMAAIARQTFPKSINIIARYPESVWEVEGDPTQLHQVLLNLCINARDA
ncbi:MAG: PAS domain S-box protein, partial [Chthoniobacteraceae bacterium]